MLEVNPLLSQWHNLEMRDSCSGTILKWRPWLDASQAQLRREKFYGRISFDLREGEVTLIRAERTQLVRALNRDERVPPESIARSLQAPPVDLWEGETDLLDPSFEKGSRRVPASQLVMAGATDDPRTGMR